MIPDFIYMPWSLWIDTLVYWHSTCVETDNSKTDKTSAFCFNICHYLLTNWSKTCNFTTSQLIWMSTLSTWALMCPFTHEEWNHKTISVHLLPSGTSEQCPPRYLWSAVQRGYIYSECCPKRDPSDRNWIRYFPTAGCCPAAKHRGRGRVRLYSRRWWLQHNIIID